MKKALLIILGLILFLFMAVALAGMYKFNYLASKDGYDADGNKIKVIDFNSCLQAGGQTTESYPRQCFWEDMGFMEKTIEAPIETPKQEKIADYKGLSVKDAQILAEQNGVSFRVVEQDGRPLPATMDYRPGRINAVAQGDQVIGYTVE